MTDILKHTKENGCRVHFLRTDEIDNGRVRIHYCDTHKVELCQCGVEWFKHAEYFEQLSVDNILEDYE